jgi:hypothetical protein
MAKQELRTERFGRDCLAATPASGISEIFSAVRTARRDFALS